MKVYCEHGALTSELKQLQAQGLIELVHFPYDENSGSRHLSKNVVPSQLQWRDANLKWSELRGTWNDLSGSSLYEQILEMVGPNNRRDALHVDTAYKNGCAALVTKDRDILNRRAELESLTGLRIFHALRDCDELRAFISAGAA